MTEAILARLSPDALLLEPREHYDKALIDATDEPNDHWPRKGGITVAVYSREKCIEAIMGLNDCDDETAADWFEYNTSGGWNGEGTPTFRSDDEDLDEPDYLANVVACGSCGERWCLVCETHWATCPCPGPG